MASEASGEKSGTGDLPDPYTLSLAAQMAAAPWTDEPAYRDQVRTLKGKLIGSAHECGLCGGDVLADVAARAVITWLIRRHGFTDPKARETEVETAIDMLDSAIEEMAATPGDETDVLAEPERGVPDETDDVRRNVVWHGPDKTPPAEFKDHGPLTGQKKQLAKWILSPSGRQDPRGLDTLLKSGRFWGRKDGRRAYAIWFSVAARYAEANANKLRDQTT